MTKEIKKAISKKERYFQNEKKIISKKKIFQKAQKEK